MKERIRFVYSLRARQTKLLLAEWPIGIKYCSTPYVNIIGKPMVRDTNLFKIKRESDQIKNEAPRKIDQTFRPRRWEI